MESQSCSAEPWVNAESGQLPLGAVVGGREKSGVPLYIARARHEGDIIPGKLNASHRCAYVPWGGKEHVKSQYEVLVGKPINWVSTSGSNIPCDAFIAGETYITKEPMYVGRVNHDGSIVIGKVLQSQGACFICYGGKEIKFKEYEILMA